ncbi:MAG: hypothetical protein JNJ46_10345 [Myxococcales bacterium]|nr:hypothetical protein [Myxococcales bacterium]
MKIMIDRLHIIARSIGSIIGRGQPGRHESFTPQWRRTAHRQSAGPQPSSLLLPPLIALLSGCVSPEAYVKKSCTEGTLRECMTAVEKHPKQAGQAGDLVRTRCDAGGQEECLAAMKLYSQAGRDDELLKMLLGQCEKSSADACMAAALLLVKKGDIETAIKAVTISCVRGNVEACKNISEMAQKCDDVEECGKVADAIQDINNRVDDPDVKKAHFEVVDKLCHKYKVANSCDNAADNLMSRKPQLVAEALQHYALACKLQREASCKTYVKLINEVDVLCRANNADACAYVGTVLTGPTEDLPVNTDLKMGRDRLLRACRLGNAPACERCANFVNCCPPGETKCRKH